MTILKNEKKAGGTRSKGGVPNANDPQGANQFAEPPRPAPNLSHSQPMYPSDYALPGPSAAASSSYRRFGHNLPYCATRFVRDNLTNVVANEFKGVQGKRLHRTLLEDSVKRRKSLLVNDNCEISSSPPPPAIEVSPSTSATAENTEEKGCNSEDEYESRSQESMTADELNERELRFAAKMSKKGLMIKPMGEDGACLFRAVADQVYGDQEMHVDVRKHCMDYIVKNRDYFSQYITEDFNDYINRKRLNHVHGNHIEIQAISEMYNRTIEVYCYRSNPMNTFHRAPPPNADFVPIRLSYHRGTHYNSVVDPNNPNPTIEVGFGPLGLPPGLAEQNLEEATKRSEEVNIEQTMLDDKLRATDWEATDEAINEEVVRESYLQWLRENEKRGKRSPKAGTSAAPSSSRVMFSPPRSMSPNSRKNSRETSPLPSSNLEPTSACAAAQQSQLSTEQQNVKLAETLELAESLTFVTQLPPDLFGVDQWDDSQAIMAQVLAASQQEYLDNLKSQSQQQSQSQRQESQESESNPDCESSSTTTNAKSS